jgi:hypothetical protein
VSVVFTIKEGGTNPPLDGMKPGASLVSLYRERSIGLFVFCPETRRSRCAKLTFLPRFTLLRLESKTRGKGDVWTDDTGSSWSVAGAAASGGSLALELSPSEHFTLEAGIDSIFDFNASDYQADLTKLSGGFACVFKL